MAGNALYIEAATHGLKDLDQLRREQDLLIRKINKIHARLAQTPPELAEKYQDKIWSKLRDWYSQVKSLAEKEETCSSDILISLDALLVTSQQPAPHRRKADAGDQKRKRVKSSDTVNSPTVPRTSADTLTIAVGDQVAARITPEDSEKSEWIVVKVTRYDREANRYEVIDEEPGDDEENGGTGGPRKYKLATSAIIQLPRRTEPATALDFPNGSQVLAVYPGTTALYKATVVVPRKVLNSCSAGSRPQKKTDDYTLEFDDDDEDGYLPKRGVPFYHVVTLPEGHRQ